MNAKYAVTRLIVRVSLLLTAAAAVMFACGLLANDRIVPPIVGDVGFIHALAVVVALDLVDIALHPASQGGGS